jgi:DNA polymerase-1
MPLVMVLAEMENRGVLMDDKKLAVLDREMGKKLSKLEYNIWEEAGEHFNINSPKQLKEVLFEKLKLSTDDISKTKTGYSTARDELVKLRDKHPVIPLIEEHRELSKLLNTYVHALPKLVNPDTGRIHTSFNQTVTATGRLSSTDPNLQNIPARTKLGNRIRQVFVSEKGFKLLSLDYSQIELRLAAHMSGDEKMIKAFKDNMDIHIDTAAKINAVDTDKVTDAMRKEAKAINFGILYGQGPYGLSRATGISYARAKEFIDAYFDIYSGVKDFIDDQIEKAYEKGYVETIMGRKRYLPEINSQIPMVRKGAERMAINTPLQGSNADMIKMAMIKIGDIINKKYKDKVRMIIQVHDELVFEVENGAVEDVAREFTKVMEGVRKLKVPIKIDAEYGNNWGEMKEIEL